MVWPSSRPRSCTTPAATHEHGLDALLERWLAFFEAEVFPGGCFFIASALDFADRPGRIRDALEKALDRELEVLEAAIIEAREAGELSERTDAPQTAFELHAIVMHAHTLFRVKRDARMLERARPALRRVLEEARDLGH